ncbi:hypothetical protein LZ554_002730 [Drepanopeziza brunnea f. sp. 'monogermtubi']|nr:hypothetical protein LZ554_002730 [Drepanopeziza brunnea f. sp. 'monogermtubi']
MTELASIFSELGISHYLYDFIEQGFDTWETILDITESDFDALGVKLGHRRKLQRKIANSRGLSSDRALASPRNTPTDERNVEEQKTPGVKVEGGKEPNGCAPGGKRKYRRHPKPDDNAPERPPSAYVIFSNKMREDLKGRNLSFTEIAKLVGENWQNLSPSEKDPYEQQASAAKERYNNELAEYKKTEHYTEYMHYLAEFKARHSNPQQTSEQNDVAKRPKLEPTVSTATPGTAGNGTTQPPHDGHLFHDSPPGPRGPEPPVSNAAPWHTVDSQQSSPQIAPNMKPSSGVTSPQVTASSPTVLPGFRDSIYPSLPRRDGLRDDNAPHYQQLPRFTSVKDRQNSISNGATPTPDNLNLSGAQQFAHRTGQNHPPPLLTSESTNRSTASASSGSTVSSVFYSPRTPMEPSLERALPIPSLYPQKSNGSFEHQLPPIRRGSPHIAHGAQPPPNGTHTFGDFSSSMPPMRGYVSIATHPLPPYSNSNFDYRGRHYTSGPSNDDTILDPVSALLRAGEIVNQNSRGRSDP